MGTEEQSPPHETEVVLLIHGTNAGDPADAGDRWWQRESEFWHRLSQNLGTGFECQRAGDVFHWSGLNSEKHRRAAATALAQRIVKFEDAKVPYHLIGHSHGGSVIWLALQSAIAVRPGLPCLKSWSSIGTPFLHYAPTAVSWWWTAPAACALTSIAISIPHARSYFDVIGEAARDPSATLSPLLLLPLFWILPVIFWAVLFIRIVILLHTSTRVAVERRMAETAYSALWNRYVAVWCEVDEAIGGLASTLGFKGTVVPRMRTVSSSVLGYLRSLVTFPIRAVYNAVFAPASDEFIWDRITRRLQGNDRFGYDLVRVTRGPMPAFPSWPQLPSAISEQLVKIANDHAASTLETVRNVLGLAASSNSELPSLVTAIGAGIHGQELVHTLYYSNANVCDLLAWHVAGGRNAQPGHLSRSAPSMIASWLEHGSAGGDPAAVAAESPVAALSGWHQPVRLLRAVQSVTMASALTLALVVSSTVYAAVVYPYTEQYQIEHIANQDIMVRIVVSGTDLTESPLKLWATAVTRAGFEDRALATAARIDSSEKRLLVMATIAHELLQEGRSNKAISIIDDALALVRKSSPEMNDDGFRAVAEELAHLDRVQDALAVVKALSPDRDDWKSEGLRQVASGQADAGKIDDALSTLNRISDLESRTRAFEAFLRERPKDPANRPALDALLLLTSKVSDERGWRSGSLGYAAEYLVSLGDIDRALAVARSVPIVGFRETSLAHVADALIRSGRLEIAETTIKEILGDKPKTNTNVALTLARFGQLAHRPDMKDLAAKLLDAGLVAAQNDPFPETLIGDVAVGWAELGETAKCFAVLEKAPIGFYKDESFEPIKTSMARLAALGLTDDARKHIDSTTDQNRKSLTLLALALTYDEPGRRALLLQIEKMVESITNETDQSFTRSQVAEAWVDMNQYRYALRLSEPSRSFDRIDVQRAILNRYLERGKPGNIRSFN